jgi:hypothetical protein
MDVDTGEEEQEGVECSFITLSGPEKESSSPYFLLVLTGI